MWNKIVEKAEAGKEYSNINQDRLGNTCLKTAWVAVALHEGFHFSKEYKSLTSAPNTVNGQVVHWTVGALLYRTRFYPLR